MLLQRSVLVAALVALGAACADDTPNLTVTFTNLEPLNAATEGTYEGWVIDQDGLPFSTGKFTLSGTGQHTFVSPIPEPTMFVLTVEPPGDNDQVPSDQKILGGPFVTGSAALSALGFVATSPTANFTSSPGTHVLLTPTDGANNNEDAGIWLLQPPPAGGSPSATVNLPVLASGWIYEGWIVYLPGTAQQVAISYGKFAPQSSGVVADRDSDAGGPWSGAPGNLTAGPPFPGGDFVQMNGTAVPGGIVLPVDFNGDDVATGDSDWMHVISIEPAFDVGEGTGNAVPFQLKPFGDPFGDGGPTDARTIMPLNPLPTGSATIN